MLGDRQGHCRQGRCRHPRQEALHGPHPLERPGYSAPPRLYNEVKYEGLRRFAQPLRKLLLHTRLDEKGLEGKRLRMSRLLYETGKLKSGGGEKLGMTVDLSKLFDQSCWLWDYQALPRLP